MRLRHLFLALPLLAGCSIFTPASEEDLPTAYPPGYKEDAGTSSSLASECPPLRSGEPNETIDVTFGGAHFNVPYNKTWGRGEDSLEASEHTVDALGAGHLYFGPPEPLLSDSCEVVRRFEVMMSPPRTQQQLQRDLDSGNNPVSPTVKKEKLGENEVLIYPMQGGCSTPNIEVLGTDNNLQFSSVICMEDEESILQELKNIVATVHFIK